ncbi:MAG: helix-hairpin-helix domain-containing protein [Oscillospiraceae bacterium]|nr:helix-hairpin-helix domain-containing protein [Oscillospiraceae bacterium]
MQKKIVLPCAIATALLIGFLVGHSVLETVPSDGFVIAGERETEIVTAVYNDSDLGRIDINTASAVELTDLPGIGPALSQRIIEYREEHGPFADVDGLINVKGIGEKVLERLRPFAAVKE